MPTKHFLSSGLRRFVSWLSSAVRRRESKSQDAQSAQRASDQEALHEELHAHLDWVTSNGASGKRLDWSGRKIDGMDLSRRVLTSSILRKVSLVRCNLEDVQLANADLTGACLHDSKLIGADLTCVSGLNPMALAGCDLAGAILPETDGINESFRNAKSGSEKLEVIFLSLVVACILSWGIMGGVTDLALVINDGQLKLPLFDAGIHPRAFFTIVPLVLSAVFIFFRLELESLCEVYALCPRRLPDGRSLRTYMPGILVHSLVPYRGHAAPFAEDSRQVIRPLLAIGFGLALVPATLFMLWLRYLPTQHFGTTIYQIVVFSVTAAFLIYSQSSMSSLSTKTISPKHNARYRREAAKHGITSLAVVAVALFFWLRWSFVRFEDTPRPEYNVSSLFSVLAVDGVSLVPSLGRTQQVNRAKLALSFVRDWTRADASKSEIAALRDGIKGNVSEDYMHLQRPVFARANLVGSRFDDSTMVGCVFEGCMAIGGSFQGCDLRGMIAKESLVYHENWGVVIDQDGLSFGARTGSTFRYPEFQNANFARSDMRYAVMLGIDLAGGDFSATDLRHAKITIMNGSDLHSPSSMIGADLEGATLNGPGWGRCKFYGARLDGADLADVQLDSSNCIGVIYDNQTRFPAGFVPPPCARARLTTVGALKLALLASSTPATNLVSQVERFMRDAARDNTLAVPLR